LLITGGRLGDLFGPRQLFAAGLVIFTAASALCGLSQDANQLIAARVIQGVGAALLAPQTLTILMAIFPPERRGAAFGITGAVIGVSTVAGPTLGGLIVTNGDWRWIFFLNVPFGLLCAVLAFWFVSEGGANERIPPIDLFGFTLLSAGLTAELGAFETIGKEIISPAASGLLVIAGVASGVGKTTVTLAIIAALRRRGYKVQPFKGGPDFLDSGHHARISGRRARNLDTWMLSAEANRDGPIDEKGTYAFQRQLVEDHLAVYASKPFVNGALVWALRDFRVRPDWDGGNPKPQSPLNQKGLEDETGKPKPAFAAAARIFHDTPAMANEARPR